MPEHNHSRTAITLQMGEVAVMVEASVCWTPEMIEDTLNRMRRSGVAAARQLGLVGVDEEVEPEDDDAHA